MMITEVGVHIWKVVTPDRPRMPGRQAHLKPPLGYEQQLSDRMAP